jgi:hypothetical protein
MDSLVSKSNCQAVRDALASLPTKVNADGQICRNVAWVTYYELTQYDPKARNPGHSTAGGTAQGDIRCFFAFDIALYNSVAYTACVHENQ